ncbi:MAG: family 43 glycosylhydrolase [Clostridia bacterium]|nr:family 43 glycosylhydrolase [Clostridia bacterium]
MKRFFSFLLALLLCCGALPLFSACRSDGPETADTTAAETADGSLPPETSSRPAGTETAAADTTDAATAAPGTEPPAETEQTSAVTQAPETDAPTVTPEPDPSAPILERLSPSDGKKLRIAFIGDSITQGTGTSNQTSESYPGQLQALLGSGVVVGNFGKASAYTLAANDPYNVKTDASLSYRNTQQYKDSLSFGADIVVIALGCNDIRSFSCEEALRHYKDALASLANEYAALPTVQKVYIATHIKTTNAAVIRQFSEGPLQALQREVAAECGYELIDIYAMTEAYFNVMLHFTGDRVHPNKEQYGEMARAYCAFFKGETFTPAVPETSSTGVVYLKAGGQSAGKGAAPSTAVDSLAKAVGLLRETGGTVVICGPYSFSYELHLPATEKRITVTTSYGGTDYAASAGAYLGIGNNLYLYGDYTFEDLTVRSDFANSIIVCNYHDTVFGAGITSTLKSGITTYPLLLVGYNVASGGIPVESVSLHGSCAFSVASGTWSYLRGGNRRSNPAFAIGTVDPGARLKITVSGGTYTNSSGSNMTAATGMNSFAGECEMTITGGTFMGSVYAVGRVGTNSTPVSPAMTGKVTLTVSGAEIRGTVSKLQDNTTAFAGTVKVVQNGETLGERYLNPVATGADPFILPYGGKYYLYSTNAPTAGYKVSVSDDLADWVDYGYCLQTADVYGTPTSSAGFWAPEVYEYGGTFYLIYTVEEHLGVAVAASPLGPFKSSATSFLFDYKTIDGHLFFDGDGKVYLYFVKVYSGNHIYGVEFDMKTLKPKGTPVHLLSPQSGTWERVSGTVAEGPFVLKHNGLYYLTYSANGYTSQDYALGSATSSSPLGAFTRTAGNPFLKKDPSKGVYGPGHHSFFTAANGEPMIVYHIHNSATTVHSRLVCIDRYSFVSDAGGPDRIVIAGPTNTPQPTPN